MGGTNEVCYLLQPTATIPDTRIFFLSGELTLLLSFDSLVDLILPTPKMNSRSLQATYWDWNFIKGSSFLSKSGEITVLEKINYLCALGGKWVNESWSAAISATVPHLLGHFGVVGATSQSVAFFRAGREASNGSLLPLPNDFYWSSSHVLAPLWLVNMQRLPTW